RENHRAVARQVDCGAQRASVEAYPAGGITKIGVARNAEGATVDRRPASITVGTREDERAGICFDYLRRAGKLRCDRRCEIGTRRGAVTDPDCRLRPDEIELVTGDGITVDGKLQPRCAHATQARVNRNRTAPASEHGEGAIRVDGVQAAVGIGPVVVASSALPD